MRVENMSYKLDDDEDNFPFLQKLRNSQVPNHFVLPKIPKYEAKHDPAKYQQLQNSRKFERYLTST